VASAVAYQFAETSAAISVKRISGTVANSVDGLSDAVSPARAMRPIVALIRES
jgi:hypothetical protein